MAAPGVALLVGLIASFGCQCGLALRVPPEPREEPSARLQRREGPAEVSDADASAALRDFLEKMPKDLVSPPLRFQWRQTGMSRALGCLHKGASSPSLRYPADAEKHVEEIRQALLPWNPRQYVDTCHVEDLWTIGFAHVWFNRTSKMRRLSDFFGPYVPIFTKWVYPTLHNCCGAAMPPCRCPETKYPEGMVEALRRVLRPDVLYVAVSASDEGIVGKMEFSLREFPNIMVLSAGGYGHVPVPLQSGADHDFETAVQAFDAIKVHDKNKKLRVPVSERRYFLSFVGTVGHAPHKMREAMKEAVNAWAAAHGLADKVLFYRDADESRQFGGWNEVMYNSRFSLVPRGFGRTSYHLAETLHRGLIPIHVYSDVPWVPYQKLVEEVGFVTDVAGLPPLLTRLLTMSDEEVSRRESRALELAKSHFSVYPVMEQMSGFLTGGGSDLVCQGLPPTIRDEDIPYPPPPGH